MEAGFSLEYGVALARDPVARGEAMGEHGEVGSVGGLLLRIGLRIRGCGGIVGVLGRICDRDGCHRRVRNRSSGEGGILRARGQGRGRDEEQERDLAMQLQHDSLRMEGQAHEWGCARPMDFNLVFPEPVLNYSLLKNIKYGL